MDIKHLAELACLSLDPEEAELLAKDMERIEGMIVKLPDIDGAVQPKAMELREDAVSQKYTRDQLLANASKTTDGFIVIPETVV
ncbi:MAG: Asp-tRNA(Asn)/Glu-tRNA(Gln) amidotransferase subunit GatC [Ruminococcus sp.]|nr:Asp-tRNA(Asn)/Glu-tRNA(Gln) amidotransferase subunit GatC [Ruminococcus sp.]